MSKSAVQELSRGVSEVHKRVVEFIPARLPQGKFNSSGSTDNSLLKDYNVFFVGIPKRAEDDIEEESKETEGAAQVAQDRSIDAFKAYLPKEELYPDAIQGDWEKLLKWQRVSGIGPGFENLGNTCFLNSVLQCLTYLPLFAQLCIGSDASSQPLGMIAADAKKHATAVGREDRFCALDAMVKHMKAIHSGLLGKACLPLSKRASISPTRFVRNLHKISHATMRVGIQHDAHEFLRLLVDGMQESCALAAGLKETTFDRRLETSAVMRMFGGYTESTVSCSTDKCKQTSSSFEPFMDVSLNILDAGIASVEDALSHHLAKENLEGEYVWNCPSCGKVGKAAKQLAIRKAPNLLVLHLKRFGFGTRGKKINKSVQFQSVMDLSPFLTLDDRQVSHQYSLCGVVVHCGQTMNLGHYIAFVRAPNGLWYEVDDDVVRQVGIQNVLSQQAYLLFYSRMTTEQQSETTADTHVVEDEEVSSSEEPVSSGVGALASFATNFVPSSLPLPRQEGSQVRSDLFGNFLTNEEDENENENATRQLAEEEEEEEEEGDEESKIDREAERTLSMMMRLSRLRRGAVKKFWNVYSPRVPMSTKRLARQVEAEHYFRSYVLSQSIASRIAQQEHQQGVQGEVSSVMENEDTKEDNDLRQSESDEQEVTEEEKAEQERRNRRKLLANAAKADNKVIVVQRPSNKNEAGRQNWLEHVKSKRKRGDAKEERLYGRKHQYDEWDAALDRGKMKKVKSVQQTGDEDQEETKKVNMFQAAQNKRNKKEAKRKGIKRK